MNKEIIIANKKIGLSHKPFIIAEMSGNHNQSLDRALAIVDAAAKAGADAIKLQTYTADTITIDNGYTIKENKSLWKGKNLYQLYQQAHTPWEWHKAIFKRAREKKIICFSSPFDETAVDFLEKLNAPAYKIASFENTHHPLLRKVAATGKPIIISTGVTDFSDIKESVQVLRKAGCKNLILLKCTSTYPASPENTNILTIPDMRQQFKCPVGLSDHTMGIGVSVASVALGACMIEKHFTLSRADGGVDSAFSLEPHELSQLVKETENAFLSLGKISYTLSESEKKSLMFKRSVYAVREIKAGEKFSDKNIKVLRPALGLPPKYYDILIGKKAKRTIPFGKAISPEDF
jgi:pseudaminic acid synthase